MPKIQAVLEAIERTVEKNAHPVTDINEELDYINDLVASMYAETDESKLNTMRLIAAVAVRCQVNHGIVEKPS